MAIDAGADRGNELGYRRAVPRTDENGRQLGALLNYLLDGQVTNQQIYQALGISSSCYYRRIKQDDFPNPDELYKIAERFGLSFTDLQVRLGFLTHEDLMGYIGSAGIVITDVPRAEADAAF